jgi:hypothetical protein
LSSLRLVSLVSGLYDTALGLALLVAAAPLAALFGTPPPQPPVFGDTNGLFLLCIGIGYWLPFRDPERWRAYLWLMGPWLKGAGAAIFLVDHLVRQSPPAFLLFALTDGTLAAWTLWALVRTRDTAAGGGR